MEILRSPDDNNISYQNITTNKYISNICKDLEKVEDLPNFASQQTFSQQVSHRKPIPYQDLN
jgi:hypothetical protein